MAKRRSVLRSLVAGALIGFAEAAPMDRRLSRPPGVVWRDERDLPDPLEGVPLWILDPVPLGRASRDTRRPVGRAVRLALAHPVRLLRRLRGQLWQSGQ